MSFNVKKNGIMLAVLLALSSNVSLAAVYDPFKKSGSSLMQCDQLINQLKIDVTET